MKDLAKYRKLIIHVLMVAGALLSAGLLSGDTAVIVTAILGVATSLGLYSVRNAPTATGEPLSTLKPGIANGNSITVLEVNPGK